MELDRYLPFYRLGFACNPFKALTPDEIGKVAIISDEITNAYKHTLDHLQILGSKGRGKTTTLMGLASHTNSEKWASSYEYLADGQESYRANLSNLNLFFLDEAQRLNKASISRLVDTASDKLRIVFSSHKDLSDVFQRKDLGLSSFRVEVDSPTQIDAIISRRLEYFSREAVPSITLSNQAKEILHLTFGTDIRAMLDLLYEVFQDRREKGEVKVSDLVQYDIPQSFA